MKFNFIFKMSWKGSTNVLLSLDFEAAGWETMHQRDSKSFRNLKTIIFTGWLFAALPLFSSAETLLTEPEALKIVFPKFAIG